MLENVVIYIGANVKARQGSGMTRDNFEACREDIPCSSLKEIKYCVLYFFYCAHT